MKSKKNILLSFCCLCFFALADDASSNDSENSSTGSNESKVQINSKLRSLIIRFSSSDINNIDNSSILEFKAAIDIEGWPSAASVGRDAIDLIPSILLKMSSNPEFQDEFIDKIESDLANREVSVRSFAWLDDQLNVSRKQNQNFGTQFQVVLDQIQPYKIKDPTALNELRDAYWLPPMNTYIKEVEDKWKSGAKIETINEAPRFSIDPILRPNLLNEALSRAAKDQESRDNLAKVSNRRNTPEYLSLKAVDDDNVKWLKTIKDERGFPSIRDVGYGGAQSIWLLCQHAVSDIPLFDSCQVWLQQLVQRDEFPRSLYALILDRDLMLHNKPQIYGTQIGWMIEDSKSVDQRRAEMNLRPIAEYQAQFSSKAGQND